MAKKPAKQKKPKKKLTQKPKRKPSKKKVNKKKLITDKQRLKNLTAENKVLHEELRASQAKKKYRTSSINVEAVNNESAHLNYQGLQALVDSQRKEIADLARVIEEIQPESPPKKRLDMDARAFRFQRNDFCRVSYDFDVSDIDDSFLFHLFADLHSDMDGGQFADKAFYQYRKDASSDLKFYRNIRWMSFGDDVNLGRSSENAAVRNKPFSGGYRRKSSFNMQKEAEYYEELMAFSKGHWLFKMPGNHDAENDENVFMTQLLCDMFKCDHLGQAAEITLKFHFRGEILKLPIIAQHDLAGGGGIMRETAIKRGHNANKEFGSMVAVHAHHHHLIADADVVKSGDFKQRPSISVGCGGYQLMFGDGQPCWGKVHKGIRALGTPVLKVRFIEIKDEIRMLIEATPRMYLEV